MTFDTVPFDTPAARATSSMVGWVRWPRPSGSSDMGNFRQTGAAQQVEPQAVGRGHAALAVVESSEAGKLCGANAGGQPRLGRNGSKRRICGQARVDAVFAARRKAAL